MDVSVMPKEIFIRFFLGLLLITGFAFKTSLSYADASLTKRPEVKRFIHEMAKEHGFKQSELTKVLANAVMQPKIIESITRPYEKKPWDVYKNIFIKPERLQEGIAFWQHNQAVLKLAERKYGVPQQIILAVLGVETRYGVKQGEYRVLDALTTLAFNYPPRAAFFRKELAQFLLLCREQNMSPYDFTGSYAGAIGIPQFMPSSYRYYADDFVGNKKKDLMHDDEAAIASVGNYLQKHGFNLNAPVVQQAKGKPNKNLPNKALIIKLDTQTGPEYWIAYPNFYVITKYNNSPQYALVVSIFAEQLKQQWAKMHGQRLHAYS